LPLPPRREVAVTFEEWLKDRPYAHQVPPMTKLWMEDAWQAALRRAAEIVLDSGGIDPNIKRQLAKAIEADRD
jgi:hypothetical protein